MVFYFIKIYNSKKRRNVKKIICIILTVLIAAAAATVAACSKRQKRISEYDIFASYDSENKTLKGTVDFKYYNDTRSAKAQNFLRYRKVTQTRRTMPERATVL